MQADALTFLSYGLIGYLLAPVITLLLISVHKEGRGEQPLKGILGFPTPTETRSLGLNKDTLCLLPQRTSN